MLLGYEVGKKRSSSENGVVYISSISEAGIISSYRMFASLTSYEGRHCQVRNSGKSGTRLDCPNKRRYEQKASEELKEFSHNVVTHFKMHCNVIRHFYKRLYYVQLKKSVIYTDFENVQFIYKPCNHIKYTLLLSDRQ